MKWGLRFFAVCAVLFFALLIPKKSLAFDWPSHRMGPDNNAVVFDINNMFKTDVSDPIALDLGNPNNLVRPVIGGGKIFILSGASPSILRAVSLATGQTLWTKTYPSQVTKVLFYNNFLYISSNFIAKLNPDTGEEVFRTTKDSANKAIPNSEILQITNGKIYAIKNYIGPSSLFILNADNGQILNDPNKAMNEYVPTALIGDNQFYLIRQSRTIASTQIEAFDASYNSLWISPVCPAKAGSAVLDKANNAIHLVSTDGRVCGYNATTGSPNYVKLSNFAKYFVKYGDVNYSTQGTQLVHYVQKAGLLPQLGSPNDKLLKLAI